MRVAKSFAIFGPEKKARFLKRLADGFPIEDAAAFARTTSQTVRNHRRADPEFDRKCVEAYNAGTDAIEAALVERGKKRDTVAAIFILKSRDRARFGDRVVVDLSRATPEQIADAVAAMSDEQLAAILAKRSAGNG